MDLKSMPEQKISVFTISGNVLGENVNGPLLQQVTECITAGNNKIIFNLADMKYINSTGLGMMLTALTKTRNSGGEMLLVNLPDQMSKLLTITKLDSIFKTAESEEQAIALI